MFALCGCDQLFNLRNISNDTGDAGIPFDPMCPAPGEGPPIFADELHEVLSRDCRTYTTSAQTGRALAYCNEGLGGIEEGPIDGALSPATIIATPAGEYLTLPSLAPEGDLLYVKQQPPQGLMYRVAEYRRTGSQWELEQEIASGTAELLVGVPSAAPNRRIMMSDSSVPAGGYREFSRDSGSWVEVRTGLWSEIAPGTFSGRSPSLSVDGLRLTFVSDRTPYYADRPSLDMPFGPAVAIKSLGSVNDLFVSPNCERAYYNAAGSVLFRYLQQ
jgi:hypothetical protein